MKRRGRGKLTLAKMAFDMQSKTATTSKITNGKNVHIKKRTQL